MFSHEGFGADAPEEREVHLNLTPMIDVLTCLLFFLLLSFGALVMALIKASTPIIADGASTPNVAQLKITMGLSVTEAGFVCSGSHDKLGEAELAKLKKTIPKVKGAYDYKALNDFLYEVKQRFPNSDNVIITPDGPVPYEALVATLDASREKAAVINKRPYKLPLFPAAVVSTLVK